jgi:hypothetical protein
LIFLLKGEQMQKDMNIDTLPSAVVFERATQRRDHSDSIISNVSVDSFFESGDIDPEIAQAMLDFETSDSPGLTLRKKLAAPPS